MSEDLVTGVLTDFFTGGWRVAPFIKTQDGYIGVKQWPKRAATNMQDLQVLIEEQTAKSSKPLVFGIVPPKGRYVVDIDTKKNVQALQLWKDKVAEAYGDPLLGVPELVVKTKSGGFHLYYSDGTDRQLHSPTSIFSKDSGIDIRGFTGMVIAPTSMGSAMDWQLGDYTIIKGRPTDRLTVLGLSKILGDSYDQADVYIETLLRQVNEALRNDSVSESLRWRLIPDALIIPSSSRDNTLYKCARLCRLAGLSQDAAIIFMAEIAKRCEASPEEPIEHWVELAADKVKRVYANESEMRMQTVSGFFQELDNAGTVLLRNVAKSYLHFRHGSTLLRLDARSTFSTENIGNALMGAEIKSDEGSTPCKKIIGSYFPKEVAYGAAMYPKANMPFFEFEDRRYVNTYHDPYAAFEPDPELYEEAKQYVHAFDGLISHVTGYEEGDNARLLDKLAWMVQKPYRRMSTATIIYSHVRGSGKDSLMALMREVVGRKYYLPINLDSIADSHTLLHDKIICTASEVQLQTNARGSMAAAEFMGKIKDLVAAKHVSVNEKFISPYNAPIFSNFFVLSNFELSSLLEPGDRRWDVFHAAEEKVDQSRFGSLIDVISDGIWLERSARDNQLRRHIIYAIRMALMDRPVADTMDRSEASMNEVKRVLMESQNPPALQWMFENLPPYFTEDVLMMACHFCPMRAVPEWIVKQMREHFGPQLKTLHRTNRQAHRLANSPVLMIKNDGSNKVPQLDFNLKNSGKTVYYLDGKIRNASINDSNLRETMKSWYAAMIARYYGNVAQLPAQKPESSAGPDLI
jgi:hypothetical protein